MGELDEKRISGICIGEVRGFLEVGGSEIRCVRWGQV